MIRKSHEPGAALHVGLWHDASSNVAPRRPLGYRIEFDQRGDDLRAVTFHREDTRDVEGFSDLQSDWQKLERALREGPQMIKALAETIGKSPTAVRVRLNEKKGRKTTHLPDGRWALLDTRHQEQDA